MGQTDRRRDGRISPVLNAPCGRSMITPTVTLNSNHLILSSDPHQAAPGSDVRDGAFGGGAMLRGGMPGPDSTRAYASAQRDL